MTDRFLNRAWWLATMSLIAITSVFSLLGAYRGIFETFDGAYARGAAHFFVGVPLGIASYLLCRHRGDLVCD
jgi:hypothetical protein